MKKSILLLVLLFGFILVGCKPEKVEEKAPSINVSDTEITVQVNETHKLIVELKDVEGNPVVNFTPSNNNIEVSNDGTVKGLVKGSTEINITVEGYESLKKTVKVTVEQNDPKINVSVSEVNIKVTETQKVTVDLDNIEGSPNIIFTSSDLSVAVVEENGTIKGVAKGSADITITVEGYESLSKTVKVNVEWDLTNQLSVDLPSKVYIGETVQPTFTDKISSEAGVSWEALNPNIATIDSSSGLITGIAEGTAKFKIKSIETGYVADFQIIVELDLSTQLSVDAPESIVAGETVQITYTDKLNSALGVMWQGATPRIATINSDGLVTAVSVGIAKFTLLSVETGQVINFEIAVLNAPVERININPNIDGDTIKTTANYKLSAEAFPTTAQQGVVWTSSNDSIATIDTSGNVKITTYGYVTFTATSIDDEAFTDSITIEIYWDVMDLIDYIVVRNPVIQKNVRAYGWELEYETTVLGSVSNYYFGEYASFTKLAPGSNDNRPGIIKTSTEFITVHDTGSAAASANASSHANYVYNGGGGTSWHYSIGNDGVYLQIPNDEVAYHAGDGSRVFKLFDTGIKAISYLKPKLEIDPQGYYTLDGERTIILAPKRADGSTPITSDINDNGIYMEIGEDGNWMMNTTWWNTSFGGWIGNGGGNRNSIGIETMINQNSDLYLTWHYTAKKATRLALEYNLAMDRIVTHHFFSGKECPQTLRRNNLYDNYLKMIEAEYLINKFLSDYTLSFISNNTTLVDHTGRILKIPTEDTQVSYLITVENSSGFQATKMYSSIIPAK